MADSQGGAASDRGETLHCSGVTDDLSSPDDGWASRVSYGQRWIWKNFKGKMDLEDALGLRRKSRRGCKPSFSRSILCTLRPRSCNPTPPFALGAWQGVDFAHLAKHLGYLKDRSGDWGTKSQGSKSSSSKRHA